VESTDQAVDEITARMPRKAVFAGLFGLLIGAVGAWLVLGFMWPPSVVRIRALAEEAVHRRNLEKIGMALIAYQRQHAGIPAETLFRLVTAGTLKNEEVISDFGLKVSTRRWAGSPASSANTSRPVSWVYIPVRLFPGCAERQGQLVVVFDLPGHRRRSVNVLSSNLRVYSFDDMCEFLKHLRSTNQYLCECRSARP